METKKFDINFKKYRKYCANNKISIPKWLNLTIFNTVLEIMKQGNKLQACKFLIDKSSEFGTRPKPGENFTTPSEFGLKWAKNDVADVISSFEIKKEFTNEPFGMSKIEILDILTPFNALAEQCLHNSNLAPHQTVYAYNNAHITMDDLRRIENLINNLKSYLR